ncbi:type VI secretion system baseplate subunit TssG [Pseudoduganella violaceinigra]|uniref:type VI secretion system baseplate subunit TssG n=1 Tax=Pseudoduganella violaceinigra TaxID=246602 RepID=UPI00042958CB|nr:type VI secretion system baseplate subunit TssG [Pseudoduganella violaceinigra]
MAPRDQFPISAPAQHVLRHPAAFDFFQAVRLLERARPDAQEIGTGSEALNEAVAFRGRIGFGFPAADVVQAAGPDGYRRVLLEVAFMCLAGADGPLPAPYAALVQRRARHHGEPGERPAYGPDDDARDFLDIFNHRLVSYFYRSRKRRRLALSETGAAPLERILFQLIGFNEGLVLRRLRREGARTGAAIYSRALLRYAGLLASQSRSMAGLESLLRDALGVAVRGTEHKGRWLSIEPRFQTAIGPHGRNRGLGQETVLGARAWEPGGAIALELGPMDLVSYRSLLPGGPAHEALVFLTRFYLREDLDVQVTLVLAPDAGQVEEISRLGFGALNRTSWLGKEVAGERYQASFQLPAWNERMGDKP